MTKHKEAIIYIFSAGVYNKDQQQLDSAKVLEELVDLKTKMDSIDFDEIQKGCDYLHNIMYGPATKHLQRLLDMLKEKKDENKITIKMYGNVVATR